MSSRAAHRKQEVLDAVALAIAPGRTADVRLTEPGTGGADFDIDVVPQSSNAAPVWITAAGDDLDVVLGKGSRLRIKISAEPQPQELKELGTIIRSVAEGRFRETVRMKRGEVDAAYGELESDEGVRVLRTNTLRKPRDADAIAYGPY